MFHVFWAFSILKNKQTKPNSVCVCVWLGHIINMPSKRIQTKTLMRGDATITVVLQWYCVLHRIGL